MKMVQNLSLLTTAKSSIVTTAFSCLNKVLTFALIESSYRLSSCTFTYLIAIQYLQYTSDANLKLVG
jgi:hypothetical protein